MSKIKSISGYIWVMISFIIFFVLTTIGVMVMSRQLPVEKLNKIFGLKISESMKGGPVNFVLEKGSGDDKYRITVHRPVFEGIGDGFIQVTWEPIKGTLPAQLNDEIDYDGDGARDFTVKFNTKALDATVEKYNSKVIGLEREWVFEYKATRGIRVRLEK